MEDKEIGTSFARYGYQARLVGHDLDRIGEGIAAPILWTAGTVHSVQKAARQDTPVLNQCGRLWFFAPQGTYIPRMSRILVHTYYP